MTTLVITKEANKILGQYLLSAKKLSESFYTPHDLEVILGDYLKNSLPNSIKIDWPITLRGHTEVTFLKAISDSIKREGEKRFFESILGWGGTRGSSP